MQYSLFYVTFESIDVAFCLKYIFSFVHNGFFVPFSFFLAGVQCVFGLFTPNISDCMENTLKPFPFHVLFSLSLLFFFSFLTRQRVFFSRNNNTTIGFDGFSLLLVYVCGSLVVSFPTFKQHQLKIFFQLSVFMFQAKHFISKHFINNVL